jgi:tetratricopeptide (TPR) repeat protein
MIDLLYNNLDGVAGLRVISPGTVLSRWQSALGDAAAAADEITALQIARDAGAAYAIVGNMVGSGNALRIGAEVHDLSTGEVARAQVEGAPDSVLALVDRLCMEILRSGVGGASDELPQLDLSRVTTSSLPALTAYLAGEQKYRRSRFRESIPDFELALERDSTFALAASRISKAYGWVEPFSDVTAEYARRAVRFADRLPQREALFLESDKALEDLRVSSIELAEQLVERYPDDASAWMQLGEAYYHTGDQGLYPEDRFRYAFQRALELDPSFSPAYIHLIDHELIRGDSAGGVRLIERHRAIDPTSPHAAGLRLVEWLAFGDDASRAAAAAALDTAGSDALFTAWARFAWSGAFRTQQLLEVSRALQHPRNPASARSSATAGVYLAFAHQGRYRDARASLDAAAEGGLPGALYVAAAFELTVSATVLHDRDRVERAVSHLPDEPTPLLRFWLGVVAAIEERWDDVNDQVAALSLGDTVARSGFEAGDPAALAGALRGYSALRRENYPTARSEFEGALADLPVDVSAFVRYELGKLTLELGEPEVAARYFNSLAIRSQARFQLFAPVAYYLGETHEALGDTEEAKIHYARFVNWWENADPELQPWVERGRRALQRLAGESRG